jgi:hypothetical protein
VKMNGPVVFVVELFRSGETHVVRHALVKPGSLTKFLI